ncbi:DUF2927 domain-containing protein [Roseovarius nitratireducens]|uniref:DUF2927 domain-containing protein n=1 Tax=Roseovarius nitratireducens TaxID=2044597 RepID=UPI000CE233C5|nr:DUF2927 domain-containing protein [Roseovarius nitratireducens]
MTAGQGLRVLAGLVLALALSACDMPVPDAPAPSAPRPPPQGDDGPSARSKALVAHYARTERDLKGRGLLRVDGGGPDTPFTDTDLMRNFERIVFFDEYAPGAGFRSSSGRAGGLRKWTSPVRVGMEFGTSVPDEQRAADRATLDDYVKRLAEAARHPVSMVRRGANFHVLVMGEDDRADGLARVRALAPDIDAATLGVFRDMPRSIHCLVVAFSERGNPYTYDLAIAWVRAEHPPLMRESCFHEELAQGLGLANDSPRARPSIFNDDDEFAWLTTHDEMLLRLLYHPDLTPGMTPDEARPILRRLLDEWQAGPV